MSIAYCVVPPASSPVTSASVPCSLDNIGVSWAGAQDFAAALVGVLAVALAFRVAVRFFLNRS